MKKTNNINLNGQVFCIDEDACLQLQSYIEILEKHYLNQEGGKEIMADIESRIGELFHEFLQKEHKEVISLPDIENVINIMGAPNVIIDEDSEYEPSKTIKRKLYRDADNRVFGGVAAGIAAYFAISVVWIRLAFILLTFFYGITFIIYLILWIVLPKAKTAKQKLEMKGESINVSNLEKNIRDTYNKVKKNSKLQNFLNDLGRAVADFFTLLGDILGKILSVLLSILAVVGLLICSFLFLCFCLLILFSPTPFIPELYSGFLPYIISPLSLWMIKIASLLIINIPLFLIIYYSSARLLKYQTHKSVLLISVSLWVLGCISGISMGIYQSINFSQEHCTENNLPLIPADTTSKLLHVKFNLKNASESIRRNNYGSDTYIYYCPDTLSRSKDMLYLKPQLYISKTTDPWPSLQITKEARGFSVAEAIRNTEIIQFDYKWQNDTLTLNDYFTLFSPQWRSNYIKLNLYIPENYNIQLIHVPEEELVNSSIIKAPYRLHSTSFINQTYQMRNGKLIPAAMPLKNQ